jgi:hypothetical protein
MTVLMTRSSLWFVATVVLGIVAIVQIRAVRTAIDTEPEIDTTTQSRILSVLEHWEGRELFSMNGVAQISTPSASTVEPTAVPRIAIRIRDANGTSSVTEIISQLEELPEIVIIDTVDVDGAAATTIARSADVDKDSINAIREIVGFSFPDTRTIGLRDDTEADVVITLGR